MAGKVLNFNVCSPLKLRNGLTGKKPAICHYSYNFPLANILKQRNDMRKLTLLISGLLLGGVINAQNWELINSNTNKNLNSVHFPTASIGYIAGDYGTILKTTDGGNNWNSLTTGIDKTLETIFFIDSQTGIAVGDYSKIIKTTNGGQTWSEKMSGSSYDFYSVYFLNSQTGFVAGNYISNPCILKTTNGGETWTAKTVNNSAEYYLFSVRFVTSNIGFAVGHKYVNGEYNGYILKSTDGGETWNEQSFGNIKAEFYSIYFLNSQIGFIVGGQYYINGQNKGVIFKTNDGGQNWNSTLIETTERLESVFFIDNQTGYIAGLWGKVLKTTDGGSTWTPININSASWLSSIWFTSNQNGIAVGYGGNIAKTTLNNSVNEIINNEKLIPYPNPSNTTIFFPIIYSGYKTSTLDIFDISGQLVERKLFIAGFDKVMLDVKLYKKGIYFYKLNDFSGKFIVN